MTSYAKWILSLSWSYSNEHNSIKTTYDNDLILVSVNWQVNCDYPCLIEFFLVANTHFEAVICVNGTIF